jgi:hypothetical protein
MLDVAQDPDWVKWAVKQTSEVLLEVYDTLRPLTRESITGVQGSCEARGWSAGDVMEVNCDVACMISPAAFDSLFLPPLIETMRTVDKVIYELDGPGVIKHLDTLLSVPEIDAFYWTPGAGRVGILRWVPLIKRILGAGKCLQVHPEPEEVESLLREVPWEGLLISASCETEQEARELVRLVARLTG